MELSMYAFFTDILRKAGAREAVRFAKENGFASVELLEAVRPGAKPLFDTVEQARELGCALAEQGMCCAAYSVSINILSDALGEQMDTDGVSALCRSAELARAVGSPFLHHTLTIGYQARTPQEATLQGILPALLARAERVAAYANALGLTVLYEPQGFYVNGLEGFEAFYGEIKRRGYAVGVCGDTGNSLYAGCDPAAFFARYAAEMRHVHIKDVYVEDERLGRHNTPPGRPWSVTADGKYVTEAYLGQGCVDLAACLSHLQRAGYAGAYSLETFYWDNLSVSLQQNLARDLQYWRRLCAKGGLA